MVPLPVMFLQSGFPLKVDVFVFSAGKALQAYLRKGEIVDLDTLMNLRRLAPSQIMTTRAHYRDAILFLKKDTQGELFAALLPSLGYSPLG